MILLNTIIKYRVVGQSYPTDQILTSEKYLMASELGTWITCWKDNDIFICMQRKYVYFLCFLDLP